MNQTVTYAQGILRPITQASCPADDRDAAKRRSTHEIVQEHPEHACGPEAQARH